METTAPNILNTSPLADRLRPETLADFLGQDEIVGSGKLLRQAITGDQLPSMIFWGPPGSGKTTLAHIIARQTKSEFLRISAVTSGLKDLKAVEINGDELNAGMKKIKLKFTLPKSCYATTLLEFIFQ